MSILSLEFLGLAAGTLILYYLLPKKIRWWALLIASGVFAALSGWQGAVHLAAAGLLAWGGGLLLEKKKDRWLLTVFLVPLIGAMALIKYPTIVMTLIKYVPFVSGLALAGPLAVGVFLMLLVGAAVLIKNVPGMPGLQTIMTLGLSAFLVSLIGSMASANSLPAASSLEFIMPLGLSYFTFQAAGYLIDVYRGKTAAQRNPFKVLLFTGYYLQLPQGPISSWKELGEELTKGHRLEPANLASGFQLMLWGFFKKLVIADRLDQVRITLLNPEALLKDLNIAALPGWFVLGGVILCTIRLYADFSGGLDLVRGISRMAGINLPENFRRPFFAKSVAEYWRRWHITLGAWFRNYVLYPLVTSRPAVKLSKALSPVLGKKTARALPTAIATLLIFLLIGIWHTANWNAVVYGGYFGLVMAVSLLMEPVWKKLTKKLRLPKGGWMTPIRLFRTWALVLLAQYFAFTDGPAQGWGLVRQSCRNWDFRSFAAVCTSVMPGLEWLIAGIALVILLTMDIIAEKTDLCGKLATPRLWWVRWPLLIALIVSIAVFGWYGESFSSTAFVYAQF